MSNEAEDIHRRWSGREDGVVSEDEVNIEDAQRRVRDGG